MNTYESKKGLAILYIIFLLIVVNLSVGVLLFITNSYIINVFCKILLICCNFYILYYLLLFITLKYVLDEENLYIYGIFNLKKVKIPLKDIRAYNVMKGKIRGVRLSGICKSNFALGRSIIDKVGVTRMFATDNEFIMYIKTEDINYAISPKEYLNLEKHLKERSIDSSFYEINYKKTNSLYKDKRFTCLFIIVSLIIIIMTLNPFILYLTNKLPQTMPLNYDASFKPILYGTSKQFAFKQMVYGALNMIVLFCMYYASYFHAKYDKKSSYIYVYIALIVSLAFLGIQVRILYTNGL